MNNARLGNGAKGLSLIKADHVVQVEGNSPSCLNEADCRVLERCHNDKYQFEVYYVEAFRDLVLVGWKMETRRVIGDAVGGGCTT